MPKKIIIEIKDNLSLNDLFALCKEIEGKNIETLLLEAEELLNGTGSEVIITCTKINIAMSKK